MTIQATLTAAEKDRAAFAQVDNGKVSDMLAYAAKKTGRSVVKLGVDFSRLSRSDAKITISEYIRWGLFYEDRYTEEQRAQFISNQLHWPIAHACNERGWSSAAEDKILASTILNAGGVSTPETLAVIDTSGRLYPGVQKISTPEALRDLILSLDDKKLFGKIVDGMVSFGAFSIYDADQTHVSCAGQAPLTYADFMTFFLGDNPYLLQKKLENHEDIAPYCSALATVRMVNLVRDSGIDCPVAVISMPQGDQIADTLWRKGNIACEINPETGEIKTVVTRDGPEIVFLEDHPTHAGWLGKRLPHWDALREMNERTARLFAPIRYQSTDIAITTDGPVIVEVNYGGGFGLPQNAPGRGLLTPQMLSFFKECGVSFGTEPKAGKFGFSFFGKG
jgi:hypothetical protein